MPMSIDWGVSSALINFPGILITVLNSKALQRLVILNYKNAEGEDQAGLALELLEELNTIQVRVLRDSNIVSCVSVVPLKECRLDNFQGCDCCE